MTARKRGPRPKGILDYFIEMNVEGGTLTTLSAKEFLHRLNTGGSALKTGTSHGAVYREWVKEYEAAKQQGKGHRAATKLATEATEKRFSLGEREIQKIRRKAEAVQKTVATYIKTQLQPELREFDRVSKPVWKAAALVETSEYRDLIGPCTMNVATPFGHRDVTRPDSLQQLASVFASAFLRAHEARISAEQHATKAEAELERLRAQSKVWKDLVSSQGKK